jgi:hypothetical protein
MREPTADELAAIAAAYLLITAREPAPPPSIVPRWRMAGRLPAPAPLRAGWTRTASRWKAAGRLDG